MRSVGYFREVKFSVVYKAIAVAASFLLVPIMLNYAGTERFGIWVTLYSVLSWVMFFDLGLANSLRNRMSACVAKADWAEAQIAVSSAYYAIGAAVLILYALFLAASFWIDWTHIFNAHTVENREIWICMLIFSFLFLANFLLSSVNQLLHATLETSRVVMGQALASILALATTWLLNEWIAPSLIFLAALYGGSQLTSSLLLNAYFFRKNPKVIPKWSSFSKYEARQLIIRGWRFFVIQLAVIAIFATDKIIMTQLFSPDTVAGYEVVYRLFSAVLIGSSLLLAPLWSSYTHLWAKGEILAAKNLLRKSNLIFLILTLPAAALFIFSERIIDLWIGNHLSIPDGLYIAVFAFVLLRIWCDIYAYFLNGTGMIRVQMWLAVAQCLMNVPLAIWLGKSYGPEGVIWASFLTLSLSGLLLPAHAFFAIRKNIFAT